MLPTTRAPQRQARVGEKAADQLQALGLRHRCGSADLHWRQPEGPGELAGRTPQQVLALQSGGDGAVEVSPQGAGAEV